VKRLLEDALMNTLLDTSAYGKSKTDWNINILRDFLENWRFDIQM
jgi:hypothetical protein